MRLNLNTDNKNISSFLLHISCSSMYRVGTKVKPMAKAKIITHKGEFESIFCPAHVTIFATEKSDIDENDIMEKVRLL